MTVICPPIRARSFGFLFFGAAVIIAGAARAQESASIDISNPNVTVDLSVLDDNGIGRGATPGGLLARPGGLRLLMPGIQPPRSRLYIRPKGMARRGPAKKSLSRLPFHATAKKVAKKVTVKRPPIKKTAPPAMIAKSAPPPAVIAPPPMSAAKKETASRPPPEHIAKAPPPPPALKPMKAETKITAKVKPGKAAVTAPQKLVPAAKKEAKKEPAKVKSGPPKAVAEIPAPAAPKIKAPKKPEAPMKKAEPEKETASLPPPAGTALKVIFAATTSRLPNPVKAKLKELAAMMKKKQELRIQLLAYAGGKSFSPSKARRLSLSRALSVRSYLIEKGIRSTRIDVRALGNKTTEEPLNRVDINIITR